MVAHLALNVLAEEKPFFQARPDSLSRSDAFSALMLDECYINPWISGVGALRGFYVYHCTSIFSGGITGGGMRAEAGGITSESASVSDGALGLRCAHRDLA